MRQADQSRLRRAPCCESAVVKSTAHAQSPSLPIETHQWQAHGIEPMQRDAAGAPGLRDTETIQPQWRIGIELDKSEAIAALKTGQEGAFAEPPRQTHQWQRIDLAVGRHIE